MIQALESLEREEVNAANAKAMEIIFSARPVLVDIQPAIDVIPGMTNTTILHAGPPITWDYQYHRNARWKWRAFKCWGYD